MLSDNDIGEVSVIIVKMSVCTVEISKQLCNLILSSFSTFAFLFVLPQKSDLITKHNIYFSAEDDILAKHI